MHSKLLFKTLSNHKEKQDQKKKKPYTKMAQEQEENITKQELLITQIIKINVLKDTLPH